MRKFVPLLWSVLIETDQFNQSKKFKGRLLNKIAFSILFLSLFFTLKTTAQSPGGVSSNLKVWLKADAGITTSGGTVSAWLDQSPNAYIFNQATVGLQPTFKAQGINSYPTLTFNAKVLSNAGGILGTSTYTDVNIYAVLAAKSPGGGTNWILQTNTTGGNELATYVPHTPSGNVFWRPGNIASDLVLPYTNFTNASKPSVWGFNASTTSGQTFSTKKTGISYNGKLVTSGASMISFTGNNSATLIGAQMGDDDISEVIAYSGPIDLAQHNKIQSYLAVKYGITLDQTVATNYVNSAGATVWDATANAGFVNNVFAVAKDDGEGLNQAQSKSVNTNKISLKNASALVDGDYLFVSDNGLNSISPVATASLPGGLTTALPNIWRVSKTGAVGTVDVTIISTATNPKLMVDNTGDGVFDVAISPTSTSGNSYTFASLTLVDGNKFTLGYDATTVLPSFPGGVSANLKWWLKANAGTSTTINATATSSWVDQSGSGNDVTQATVAKQPLYTTNGFNSNPALTFDQVDDGMASPLNISSTPYSVFSVSNDNTGSTASRRVISGSNNWVIGPFAGQTRYFNQVWIDPQNLTTPGKQPYISLGTANPTPGFLNFFYVNGKNSTANPAGIAASGSPGLLSLGSDIYNNPAGSNVAEIIAFDRVITPSEKSQIESYLAIKYGISIDQTVATNYVNSANNIVWNAATNGAYKNNIFGIGKDVLTGLNQLQSASANTTKASIANPVPALADGDFLIISDNLGASYPVATGSLPDGALYASQLVSNISITNFTGGTIDLTLSSGLPNPILMIDNDNNGSYESFKTPASNSGNNYTYASLGFSNQAKFCLGYVAAPPIGPAGVTAGLKYWFNANSGLITSGSNVTSWTDQSFNSDHASTPSGNPQKTLNAINGYPAVAFNGNSGLAGNFVNKLTNKNISAFVVNKLGTNGGAGLMAIGNGTNDYAGDGSSILFFESLTSGINVHTGRNGATFGNFTNIPLINSYHLFGTIFNATQNLFFQDGNAANNVNFAEKSFNSNKFSLGGRFDNGSLGSFSNAVMAEAILYNREVTLSERQHIQSYLAIKYGITLPTDYVTFNNTIIWNSTANSGYGTDIIGIGIDNAIGLSQQSTVSTNNDFLRITTPSALVDGDFLVIGASKTSMVDKSADVPGGITQRTERIWKVAKTGTPGTVTLQFNISSLPEITPATLSQCALLLSNSTSFAAATPYTTGMTLSGANNEILTFTGVSLNNNSYFSIGYPAVGTIVNTKWFAVPEWNACTNLNQPQYLYLTAPGSAATVVVDQPANPSFVPIKVQLAAGATQQLNMTDFINNLQTAPVNTVVDRGLRVTVYDNKVVSYYQNAMFANFGTLPLKSPHELGTEFYVPGQSAYNNSTANCGPTNYCKTNIVSAVDNNTVTITPTEDLYQHALAAGPFSVTLNRGQSYQIRSVSYSNIHMAGTHIVATGNVAVTYIDDLLDTGPGQDNAGDQLVPVVKLGSSYVSMRTNLSAGLPEQTQLIGVHDNTNITVFDGTTTTNFTINKGQRATYTIPSGINAAYISSDNPISAYQIGGVAGELGGGILPPIFTCSGSSSVAYFRNSAISQINADVIVPVGAQGNFLVNGSSTVIKASDFSVVPGFPEWMYARVNITSTTSSNTLLTFTNTNASFHLGFTELSAGGGDYCYFSDFVTVPVDHGDFAAPWPDATANTAGCATDGGPTLSNTNTINKTSVWAGSAIDFEEKAKTNAAATADLNDDGLGIPTLSPLIKGTPYNYTVTVNSNAGSAGKTVYYRLWFDWNNDGNFANDNDFAGAPATYTGSGVTMSPTTITVPVMPPITTTSPYGVRLIVSGSPIADEYRTIGATTIMSIANGEIEDYIQPSFTVAAGISGTVLNDVNGYTDMTVNGVGTNAGGLTAILVDAMGNVVANATVNPDGTYNFPGAVPGTYSIVLSTTPGYGGFSCTKPKFTIWLVANG